ncbi:hypothetical protein CTI14_47320, partial [Methylobacterium radiotolerans]
MKQARGSLEITFQAATAAANHRLATWHTRVLLVGTLMNRRGQVVSRAFFTTVGGERGFAQPIDSLAEHLEEIGFTQRILNTGAVADVARYQGHVANAVKQARGSLEITFQAATAAA